MVNAKEIAPNGFMKWLTKIKFWKHGKLLRGF